MKKALYLFIQIVILKIQSYTWTAFLTVVMIVGLFMARVASDLDRGRNASKIAPPPLLCRLGEPANTSKSLSPDFLLWRESTAAAVKREREQEKKRDKIKSIAKWQT